MRKMAKKKVCQGIKKKLMHRLGLFFQILCPRFCNHCLDCDIEVTQLYIQLVLINMLNRRVVLLHNSKNLSHSLHSDSLQLNEQKITKQSSVS